MDALNSTLELEARPVEADVVTRETFNAARLASTFREAERAHASSGALRFFAGNQAPVETVEVQLRQVLGKESQLVDIFVDAKTALSAAVFARNAQLQLAVQEELQLLLKSGARFAGDDWYLLNEFDGGEVKAKVLGLVSVRVLEEGALWGYLRVSHTENASGTWEFAWRDQRLSVRARDI